MKISVIGLGYIGLPTAVVLADAGHIVKGYDVNPAVIASLNAGQMHIKEDSMASLFERALASGRFSASSTLEPADAFIIAVPTPFREEHGAKASDLSYVQAASKMVAGVLKAGNLVILESTVPPGATRAMAETLASESGLARDEFFTAHCPERVLPGNILYEIANNDRIIGSESKEGARLAQALYTSFVKGGNIYLTDDLTAEMCKLVENSFRDVNIAFANELSIFCDRLNIDVHELIRLANHHPRVNILEPGVGVGGHCIAVDPWFLVELFGDDARLISAARHVNDDKPARVAKKLMERTGHDKKKLICILGLSYKANIDDFRESPSIKLAHILMEEGYNVIACEPNTILDEIDGIPIYSFQDALRISDVCILAVKHTLFLERIEEIKEKGTLFI